VVGEITHSLFNPFLFEFFTSIFDMLDSDPSASLFSATLASQL